MAYCVYAKGFCISMGCEVTGYRDHFHRDRFHRMGLLDIHVVTDYRLAFCSMLWCVITGFICPHRAGRLISRASITIEYMICGTPVTNAITPIHAIASMRYAPLLAWL